VAPPHPRADRPVEHVGDHLHPDRAARAAFGQPDLVDRELERHQLDQVGTFEAAAHGAAMLAATSQGAFGSVQEAGDAIVEVGPVTAPGDATAAYAAAYPLYHDLYPALRSSFAGLSALER
jgi:hypothetical protein